MPNEKPRDIVVVMARRDWTCASCSADDQWWLTMDDAGPLCLDCADLGHLDYLPAGNTALTRRAKKASRLSAVVVEWSRTRKRYERQGILAEPEAIDQAEQECLADSEVRERRRARDAERRAAEDVKFTAELAAAIRAQFPGCPPERAERIARHASVRSSGRVGRTSAGRALDPHAVRAAVIASIRHEDTRYETLLMSGVPRAEARDDVYGDVEGVLNNWSSPTSGRASAGVDLPNSARGGARAPGGPVSRQRRAGSR